MPYKLQNAGFGPEKIALGSEGFFDFQIHETAARALLSR